MPRKSNTKKEKVLILDADSSVYAVGFMTQKKTHYGVVDGVIVFQSEDKRLYNKWFKDHTSPEDVVYDYTENIEPVAFALSSCKNFVANTLKFTGCDRAVVLLTKGGNCFRHHLATIQKYKGNREGMDKPYHYDAIRSYYMDYHSAKMYNKWEADDAACMALHKGSGVNGVEYVLASIDKDLTQMLGKHVNPGKKDEGVYVMSEEEGWYNFYHQMLCGDTADNIRGLKGTRQAPGISVAKAHALLKHTIGDIPLMCQVVYDMYVIRYGEDTFSYSPWWMDLDKFPDNEFVGVRSNALYGTAVSMFRENADLLYMLRAPDDQYIPHIKLPNWEMYSKGVVAEFIPSEDNYE